MKRTLVILVLEVAAGCVEEVVQQRTEGVSQKVKGAADDISAPFGGRRSQPDDKAAREKERFDEQWRQLQSFRALQAQAVAAAAAASPTPPPANFKFVTRVKQ